jgi:non-canonical (house-cleaning) NTP pyrophosphatase
MAESSPMIRERATVAQGAETRNVSEPSLQGAAFRARLERAAQRAEKMIFPRCLLLAMGIFRVQTQAAGQKAGCSRIFSGCSRRTSRTVVGTAMSPESEIVVAVEAGTIESKPGSCAMVWMAVGKAECDEDSAALPQSAHSLIEMKPGSGVQVKKVDSVGSQVESVRNVGYRGTADWTTMAISHLRSGERVPIGKEAQPAGRVGCQRDAVELGRR